MLKTPILYDPVMWQIPFFLFMGGKIIEQRKEVREHASETLYYVECPRALYPLVGFDTLRDAREYAVLGTRSEAYRWMERHEDRIAKIFKKGGEQIETYIGGFPEEEYADIGDDLQCGEEWCIGTMSEQTSMAVCKEVPFTIKFGDLYSFPAETLDAARKIAVANTVGLYKLNGQLNDNKAVILDSCGNIIETYVSGLPEAEYDNIAEERKAGQEKKEMRTVSSFRWDASKMR